MIVRIEGLVLRTYRMTESSLAVVLFSREHGKLRLSAKGARRPKSKFGSSLQPITFGHYLYYRREGRDLQTLSEGDTVEPFPGIKSQYTRLTFASTICDLLDHMTLEEDRNPLLLQIALDALSWIDGIEVDRLELPLWYFQLKSAGCLGYRPHLSGCVLTGAPLPEGRAWFSPEAGGTVSRRMEGPGQWIDADTRRFLEHLQVTTPDRFEASSFDAVDRVQTRTILRTFQMAHFEAHRPPKSFAALDQLLSGGLAMAADAAPWVSTEGFK